MGHKDVRVTAEECLRLTTGVNAPKEVTDSICRWIQEIDRERKNIERQLNYIPREERGRC